MFAGIFYYYYNVKVSANDYLISNVPYKGLYEKMPFDYPYAVENGSVLSMAFDYWHGYDTNLPNPSIDELNKNFPSFERVTLSRLAEFFNEKGFETEISSIAKIEDFQNFINSRRRTPVLVVSALAPGALAFNPLRVVTGVSFSEKTVTVHDYFLGPDYKIPFEEFINLCAFEGAPYLTLVVYPKNYEELLKKISLPPNSVLSRSEEVNLTAQLVKKWFVLKNSVIDKRFEDAVREAGELLADKNSAFLPRFLLSGIQYELARSYNALQKFQEGLDAIDAALKSGEEMGILSLFSSLFMPELSDSNKKNMLFYYLNIKSQSYLGLKETEKSIGILEQMLAIDPSDKNLADQIKILKQGKK